MPELYPSILEDRIFWPRMTEVIGDLTEAVQQPPERPLDDAEKAEVLQFERDLMDGQFGELSSAISLEDTPSSIDTAFRFAPSYFVTDKGRQELHNFYPNAFADSEGAIDAAQTLRAIPISVYADNKDKVKKLSGDSIRYAKDQYADAAVKGEVLDDIETIDINCQPEALINRLSGNLANRLFIRQVRAELQDQLTAEYRLATEAKLVVTDIYRDRINAAIAELYPGLQQLLLQIDAQPREAQDGLQTGLESISPLVRTMRRGLANPAVQGNLIRRLDYVRNGVTIDEAGKITTVDSRVYEDADYLNERSSRTESHESLFSAEEIAALEKMEIDAETMQEMTHVYMDSIGIKGWKTELRDDVDTYSVDGINKLVKIPRNLKRTAVQVSPKAGIVALMWHEIGGDKPGHVMQHINASNDDQALRLGTHPKYKGKRVTSIRETGGIAAEASVLMEFFGLDRKARVGFARSMEVLQAGGSVGQAIAANVIAGLEEGENLAEFTDAKKRTKYRSAADSVFRLTRFGGFNSQPLVYAEAATGRKVLEDVDDKTEKVVLAEGIFDPVDMLRLHRYGLLVTSTEHLFKPKVAPGGVMAKLIRDQLEKQSPQND